MQWGLQKMKWKKDKTEEGALLNDDFSSKMKRFLINYYPVLILVGLIIVASLISDIFMSTRNISNLVRQQVTYMIIAIGVMMVLLTGGIDLSVSSIAAISSIMVAYSLSNWGLSDSYGGLALAILIGVGCGAGIGILNGFLVSVVKIQPIITTLATMMAFQGVGFIITKGSTILLDRSKPAVTAFTGFAENGDPLLNIPYPIYVAAFIV